MGYSGQKTKGALAPISQAYEIQLCGPAPQALAQGGYTWQGATFPLGQELDMVEQQVIQSSGAPLEALDLTLLTLYHASRVEKPLTRLELFKT